MKTNGKIIENLNRHLADYQMFYQNLRGFHWNIRGKHFFELHALFEQWYEQSAGHIDEIAERILMIGGQPLHTFKDYADATRIPARKNVSDGTVAMQAVAQMLETLLENETGLLKAASEAGDEGTVALVSELIGVHEKMLWMTHAWLAE